ASGATRASAMFRPRCLLKNSANNHRRLETRVSAIDSTPQASRRTLSDKSAFFLLNSVTPAPSNDAAAPNKAPATVGTTFVKSKRPPALNRQPDNAMCGFRVPIAAMRLMAFFALDPRFCIISPSLDNPSFLDHAKSRDYSQKEHCISIGLAFGPPAEPSSVESSVNFRR
ncbi:hypothetical protein, partial [Janthinobacterium sp. MDT1-19]|uniref:hypothetical protein n=1 Tax=Janthinobacterium sp. MDT1-19 TaxID=1259339 RepID=UPI003F28202E